MGGYGVREIKNLYQSNTETKEFEITKIGQTPPNAEVTLYEDTLIYDDESQKYEICNKLKKLLKEKDIILADIKKHRILKIYYIIRKIS